MKTKLRWLLLILPLALLVWAWQAASWRPKLIGVHPGAVANAGFVRSQLLISRDGKRLVSSWSSAMGDSLAVWALDSRHLLWQHTPTGGRPFSGAGPLAFSPDGTTLALATPDFSTGRGRTTISTVETATGKQRPTVKFLGQLGVESSAFLSPHELVVSSIQGATVVDIQTGATLRQWNFKSPLQPKNVEVTNSPESQISADGSLVITLNLTSDIPTIVTLYDVRTGKPRANWKFGGFFHDPRLSPDGKLWAMKNNDSGGVSIFDARTGNLLWRLLEGIGRGARADFPWAWSADGRQILASFDTRVALIDARTGRDLSQLTGKLNTQALALDPNGDYFYTLDKAGKIWRWRAR